jgi:hydroxycarboxylate dehydrogenase B
MSVQHDRLAALTAAIFRHAGSDDGEADTIARHLVEANLVGHDSHGVIRVPAYVQWVQEGKLLPNQKISVVFENDSMAVVDGNFGFGQSIGEQAVDYGIEKCRKSGLSLVGLRNAGHVGRVGDWAIRAAAQGLVSLHFVNTSGGGILVAPFGGIERRLSANPIAAGIPVAGGEPIIADLSTCVIAEGKIRVARNKGVPVPENAILDSDGKPTTDPEDFYADPPGAILTIGAHKGYVLSVLCEVMAGAITGSGCSNPNNPTAKKIVNGMCSIYIDPNTIAGESFAGEVSGLTEWVKSSTLAEEGGEILMPGDPELRTKAERMAAGIPIDDNTWAQLAETATKVGINNDEIARLGGQNA